MNWKTVARCYLVLTMVAILAGHAPAQTLTDLLQQQAPAELAEAARARGDAKRGAVLFHQAYMTCVQCHAERDGQPGSVLGPVLAELQEKPTTEQIVEAILQPSKRIRKGFETVVVATVDGQTLSGIATHKSDQYVELAMLDAAGVRRRIAAEEIDEMTVSPKSLMPEGLANQLASRQQFLDLVQYVNTVVEGGPAVAQALKPSASLLAPVLPEYESHVDHRGLLVDLDGAAFKRGEEIYQRLCINCHGTHDQPGSLPTSLRFASGKFKNGSDPYTMYQTLTRGFGMMAPQTWMVPQQKYDVIHYIREAYLKDHNPKEYVGLTADYLKSLPVGDTRGPAPVKYEPWVTMNYGPSMNNTFEVGSDGSNFAYKGIAMRLDPGAGGVSRGHQWMVFDHDTMRMAVAWTGDQFIDWNGIHFNGRHNIHPRIVGEVQAALPTGPGWADPVTGSFDDPRLVGRDDRRYGPLPREWAHYKGQYHYDQRTIIEYTVGDVAVLESAAMVPADETPGFARLLNLGPRRRPMVMRVARNPGTPQLHQVRGMPVAVMGEADAEENETSIAKGRISWDGSRYIEVEQGDAVDMHGKDFTVIARVKTNRDGVIFSKTKPNSKWVPGGKSLFVRGGHLCFDIGWVGVLRSQRKVDDGRWHDVAASFRAKSGQLTLYIDGREEASGKLRAEEPVSGHVLRIGHSAPNFPNSPFWRGELEEVRLHQAALEAPTLAGFDDNTDSLIGRWKPVVVEGRIANLAKDQRLAGRLMRASAANQSTVNDGTLIAGVVGEDRAAFFAEDGELRLTIPAGPAVQMVVWFAGLDSGVDWRAWYDAATIPQTENLTAYTQGGPPRWGTVETMATVGESDGPFAVDVLTRPTVNPWLCRVRLSGHDFLPGGNEALVTSWDGDVWLVSGLSRLSEAEEGTTVPLTWKRIASGMFQPLGIKYHEGQIFVTCRDQLAILRDLNDDGEIDHYLSFNNDHQVTDHFHEFAMGLQVDEDGYFYYAKSARHALPALVPHHGTLLRVSPDGQRTEILAVGFRAANGVCLNPDGTFIVTDQEGHWNPKNRINWVEPGGFYGNMYGYHDVTDTSDEAMTPPLCWITNSFDRSPAELLWVDSQRWGSLNGMLLNLSYGYGKVFVVPHERTAGGLMQGGMCALPIPQFPTGVMRGRFHPEDGQLYLSGMFAWAGSQHQPGGFYRLRYTGRPVYLPAELTAHENGVALRFTAPVDAQVAADPNRYAIKTWSLKRTKNYGSKHYDEKKLSVRAVQVSADGQTVLLEIDGIQPTWSMEIVYSLSDPQGKAVNGTIHNTIHELGPAKSVK